MAKPLVSILIPVYNAGKYLRPAVQSILSQTYSNLEILIIDDGSTDSCISSIADLKDPRIRTITQENSGKAVVLNRALDQTGGELYAIQDADDISYPNRIERQVQCLLDNASIAAVFTGHDIILDGRRIAPRIAAKSVKQCREDITQMRMPAHDPTGMYRVHLVADTKYEPSLRLAQGLDYILRIGELHPMMVLGECLYSYRSHSDSITHRVDQRKQMVREVLKRACQRRGLDPAKYLSDESTTSGVFGHKEQESGIVPHFMESVLDLRRAGRTWQALKTAFACLSLHPCDPYYYKPLAYFASPLAFIRYYRSRKT